MSGVLSIVAVVLYSSASHRLAMVSEVVVALSLCTGTLLWKLRSNVMVVEGLSRCLLWSRRSALTKRCCASSMVSASSVGRSGVPWVGASSGSFVLEVL